MALQIMLSPVFPDQYESVCVRLLSANKFSLCVCQRHQLVSLRIAQSQSVRCKLSQFKKSKRLLVSILNSHENPAMRHNRYLKIVKTYKDA